MSINHDNLEEYRDADTYDSINGGFEIGGNFYMNLAREYGSPILEIACGTGRITVPMAEQGYDITGVDITQEMLEAARQKATQHGVSVKWVHGDARNLELQRTYRMIFTTGNSFQAFSDRHSQERLLLTVHKHLDSNGVFAFETRNPIMSQLSTSNGKEEDAGTYVNKEGRTVFVTERCLYDHRTQLEHYVTRRRWKTKSSAEEISDTRIAIRYVFPQELEALLHYNGFYMEQMYGNFDLSPFQSDSPLMVCVCRKRPI
ncbi:class I SAM-dependent methyltransferase [Sulfoacidibacillus ferrooxidans]|uniref:Glycine/sarcosine N-methyltransferase n=1 Tax=Sulfoacidibacillus ferrooxidans TaxID=2005001 RepID=A0A9X1VC81_9BACL|nr:Glycine/sarcosine N-methyltransferase [Sulfoacidibacillus ferrooxidans]